MQLQNVAIWKNEGRYIPGWISSVIFRKWCGKLRDQDINQAALWVTTAVSTWKNRTRLN